MHSPARIRQACLIIVCLQAGMARGESVSPLLQPPEVTSDTRDYCLWLHAKVGGLIELTHGARRNEATDLWVMGHRMCEQGQFRGGVMRLRRALVILREDTSGP